VTGNSQQLKSINILLNDSIKEIEKQEAAYNEPENVKVSAKLLQTTKFTKNSKE